MLERYTQLSNRFQKDYYSTGTVKGLNIFQKASRPKYSDYLQVAARDEYFHREYVTAILLIRYQIPFIESGKDRHSRQNYHIQRTSGNRTYRIHTTNGRG